MTENCCLCFCPVEEARIGVSIHIKGFLGLKKETDTLWFPFSLLLNPGCLFYCALCQLWKSIRLSTTSQPAKTQYTKPPRKSPPFQQQQKLLTVIVQVQCQTNTSQMRERSWGEKGWQISWRFLKDNLKMYFLICSSQRHNSLLGNV